MDFPGAGFFDWSLKSLGLVEKELVQNGSHDGQDGRHHEGELGIFVIEKRRQGEEAEGEDDAQGGDEAQGRGALIRGHELHLKAAVRGIYRGVTHDEKEGGQGKNREVTYELGEVSAPIRGDGRHGEGDAHDADDGEGHGAEDEGDALAGPVAQDSDEGPSTMPMTSSMERKTLAHMGLSPKPGL